jgi:hypothetical protein
MKKVFLFLSFIALSTSAVFSQSGAFKFSDEKHDFGLIDEGLMATHEFEFVNTGTTPIIITDVKASCGCTTPFWTKEPVAPGAKGSIKASYNSEGRPGVFNKSITVTSNAVEPTTVLTIKGVVQKKEEKTPPTAEELKKSPKIGIDKNSHHFGKIERGQKVSAKFVIKNTGKDPLTVNSISVACGCVSHKLNMDNIPAGKSGILELTYSPYYDGANVDKVTVITNDLNNPRTLFTLSADVVDNLSNTSPLKEDKGAVPFK